jgi:hypothetical protein
MYLIFSVHATWSAYLILYDSVIPIIFGEQQMLYSSSYGIFSVSCQFLPLRSKNNPQNPVLNHPQSMLL